MLTRPSHDGASYENPRPGVGYAARIGVSTIAWPSALVLRARPRDPILVLSVSTHGSQNREDPIQRAPGQERYEQMLAAAATAMPTNSEECRQIQEAIQEIIDTCDAPLPPTVAAQLRALDARARQLHCHIVLQ